MRKRSTQSPSSRAVDVPRMLMLLGIEFRDHHGELWACCPFPGHDEKTPSWSIDSDGLHYCFGCEAGGGPADLVMRVYGFAAFSSALSWLEEHGLYVDGALPLEVEVQLQHRSLVRPEVQVTPDMRFVPLEKWVTTARRYARKRGVTPQQVERWGLGYAAGGWFAGRLLLPTREWRTGRLINVTGRLWGGEGPKYLNSKESHGADPSAIFGEQHWPQHAGLSTLVLCEGELNALACERVGAQYVGALGGSVLDKGQVLKLSAFQKVIIAVDMDRAGSKVAEALRATLVRWRRMHVVQFPDKRDPNDLERENPSLLKELLWGRTPQGA